MNKSRTLAMIVALGCGAAAAAPAYAATPAQFGQKCKAAWTGVPGSAAFKAYQPKCVAAAVAATDAATDAGNPTNSSANTSRSRAVCAKRFPTPRNTAAKRLAFASCVSAASSSQKAFAGRPLKATLSGANEVPPAGGASGNALIRLNQGQNRVCFTITVTGLQGSSVVGAHIHTGAASANGGVVVTLDASAALNQGLAAKGCAQAVDAALIKDIRQNPQTYYVNVHTAQFGGGAARGQLAK